MTSKYKKIYGNKNTFSMVKVSLNGNTICLRLFMMKGCDAIRPKLNCFITMIISVTKLSGFPPLGWRPSQLRFGTKGKLGSDVGQPGIWAGDTRQRLYIIETMHSYTLPMYCLSGLHLSLLTGGTAVCGHS